MCLIPYLEENYRFSFIYRRDGGFYRRLANSGYKWARAPVLWPNEFYINTKRFR